MEKQSILDLAKKIAEKASLFEDEASLQLFLRDAMQLTLEYTGTEVSAVFLYDPSRKQLIFKAGAPKEKFAGPQKFGLDENIAGAAFTQGRIVQELGDKMPAAKLAVPIHHGPEIVGVLVFGHRDREFFDRRSESSLRMLAAQFGSLLADASLFLNAEDEVDEKFIEGKTASGGVAIGTALQFEAGFESLEVTDSVQHDPATELANFDASLTRTLRQLEDLQNNESSPIHDIAALIFSTYILMLNDESFTGRMRERVVDGEPATTAVRAVVNEYSRIFGEMQETRLAEKAQDVRDLGYRLIRNFNGDDDKATDYSGQIAIARHIYPSDLVRLSVQNVAGVVLMGAAVTAHITILARTLGLPVMITNDRNVLAMPLGTSVILDATKALLHVDPDKDTRARYSAKPAKQKASEGVHKVAAPAVTADGVGVSVACNVNLYSDARESARIGADGIGLYRSEFPFIIKNDFLTEDQQYSIYRRIIEEMPGKPVILRTADIGGDKLMEGREEEEANPFLGVRGIRFSLANRDIFREQLRAMLRAGEGADLGIMVPMVASIEDILETREEVELCIAQLKEEGTSCNDNPKIGAMIELPSAAVSVTELANVTDFLSIGTNDLVMYLLAVDRTNERLSDLYQIYHPTVLRTLSFIAQGTRSALSQLSVCGDSASDPLIIPFLIGIGIRKLSVAPDKIEMVKEFVADLTVDDAKRIAKEMLSIGKRADMERYLADLKARLPVAEPVY